MVKLICLEGIDGCGKSTQVNMVKSNVSVGYCWLRYKPFLLKPLYIVKTIRMSKGAIKSLEQQYESNSMMKKKLFKSGIISRIWYSIALMDYILVSKLKLSIAKRNNKLVVLDRYFFDFLIDQGLNFGWDKKKYFSEIKKLSKLFRVPDKTILLDIPPDEALKRKHDIPNLHYLNTRYELYNVIAKELNWDIINATLPKEEINQKILSIVESLS